MAKATLLKEDKIEFSHQYSNSPSHIVENM